MEGARARHPNRASEKLVGRDPSGVPTFQSRPAKRAFKAGNLAARGHALGPAGNRAALAGSVV